MQYDQTVLSLTRIATSDIYREKPPMFVRMAALFVRIAGLALTVFAFLQPAKAEYPDHAIRIIVPFAPGGGTDVLARIIAQNLGSKWGQSVVNKVLTPIAIGAAPPYLLVANPKLPVKTTQDLIRYAKEKPDGLTYGSSGVGAASHLSGLLFASRTGIKMLHVPYKGTEPAVTDLLGGRIDIMFAPGPVVQQLVKSGRLKEPGVTDTQRSKFYPDVPTMADAVPGYESVGWFGLLAPAQTPSDIVHKINAVIVEAMQTEDFRDHLATLGAEPKPHTPEEFGRYINADVAKW